MESLSKKVLASKKREDLKKPSRKPYALRAWMILHENEKSPLISHEKELFTKEPRLKKGYVPDDSCSWEGGGYQGTGEASLDSFLL